MDQIRRFYHASDGMGLLAPDDREIVEAAIVALAERALTDWPEGWATQIGWIGAREVERERAKLADLVQRTRNLPRRRVRVITLAQRRRDQEVSTCSTQ